MKTSKKQTQIFLVLVPHRDTRLILRKCGFSCLSADGQTGAYNFPWVAPLATLSRPLKREELKNCARAIREAVFTDSGKINAMDTMSCAFPASKDAMLFGPRLDLVVSPDTLGGAESGIVQKAVGFFSPPVIGCFLYHAKPPCADCCNIAKISFRAAAVANSFWRPMNSGGYKWKIGPLCWLPAKKNKAQ